MPRTVYPPTPGSSSDIKGQDGSQKLASLQLSFELPPPALHESSPSSASRLVADQKHNSGGPPPSPPASAAYPMQAAEAVKARRRSSAAAAAAAARESSFTLPPPPTRSRKIIQMKPPQEDGGGGGGASASTSGKASSRDSAKGKGRGGAAGTGGKASGSGSGAGGAALAAASSSAEGGQQGKKKQPSATSAAGRKIARKTAHSLIERRRRSKMNEEFALLKSMIPACTGEMHKLAILQASIEYVRYLEDCVTKLKAQHEDSRHSQSSQAQLPSIHEFHPTFRDDLGGDVEMTDSEAAVSPTFTATPDHQMTGLHSRHPSASPALHAQDARSRQQSYSSVSTEYRHHGYTTSTTTSPAFGPQTQAGYIPAGMISALTSPALNPQSDLDHEATAALLMLNNDRRDYNASGGGAGGSRRAVSVRDLLTT